MSYLCVSMWLTATWLPAALCPQTNTFETIQIESADKLPITADLYVTNSDKNTPFIVLCHQAGWSRGEYREIAPKLNQLGFNCIAIDQRSGGSVNNIANQTVQAAAKAKTGTSFIDAEQDMIATLRFVKKRYATGKLILWGSSYSSALAIRIAGENPTLVDGVLAFAPGEYFGRFGKPANWIATSAAKIQCPVFVTSAKNEHNNWKGIYKAIPGKAKQMFLPTTTGNHGSRALWDQMSDSSSYWQAVRRFLTQFEGH